MDPIEKTAKRSVYVIVSQSCNKLYLIKPGGYSCLLFALSFAFVNLGAGNVRYIGLASHVSHTFKHGPFLFPPHPC
jgi:hypothetical protein